MKFYSTNKKAPEVGLKEAILNGLAPDGGLYMPSELPILDPALFKNSESISFPDIAYEVGKSFFIPEIPENTFLDFIQEAYNFPVPLVQLQENLYAYELFHGPTLAFKDFAARLMARVFGYFARELNKEFTILTATSGDTGGAVAHGFLGVPGIKVIILYPSGKVSSLQEKQLTGMGQNITALEVSGTFDDCQNIVKRAFLDADIRARLALVSANSINIARLLPQSFYYVYLCTRLAHLEKPIIVSVPSGNFGNLTAGLLAKKMKAPIHKFIAATNVNNIVPKYLETGIYQPKPSIATISNAMDVGSPSNFARILELNEHDVVKIRQDIFGASFSDEQTRQTILEIFNKYHYILDPHGAVAYLGINNYQDKQSDGVGVFLETAHPAKFPEVVEEVIDQAVPVPKRLAEYLAKEKHALPMTNNFEDLKNFLLTKVTQPYSRLV